MFFCGVNSVFFQLYNISLENARIFFNATRQPENASYFVSFFYFNYDILLQKNFIGSFPVILYPRNQSHSSSNKLPKYSCRFISFNLFYLIQNRLNFLKFFNFLHHNIFTYSLQFEKK